MACEKQYDIVAYLKDEMPPETRQEARAHIDGCPSCLRELNRVDALLNVVGKATHVDSPPGFRDKVRGAFAKAHPDYQREAARNRRSLREWFRSMPVWAVSASLHVVAIAVIAIILSNALPMSQRADVNEHRDAPLGSVKPTSDRSHGTPSPVKIGDNAEETALLLKNADPEVRRSAVIALGAIGTPVAIDHVREMTADPDERVRAAADEVLKRILQR